MSISIYRAPITDASDFIKAILIDEFAISDSRANTLYNLVIKPHFDNLLDTIWLLAESNYVDKVYRDSYYHYFSSKLSNYERDCVKISLFEGEISISDFGIEDKHVELQQKYRGFITLRPTDPQIVGRSIVSPIALKSNNFCCCTTKVHTTSNGQKFTVKGFPHSSQDGETITCAETTLWAMMEYFSNKYSDYKPVLPSKIIEALNSLSAERQVPSRGLNIQQMAFALRQFGFGTRIYSRGDYGSEFDSLLSCYIESGLPLIIAMDNFKTKKTIGHALLCIGHEKMSNAQIDSVGETNLSKGIKLYDYAKVERDYIFIDDNRQTYQKAKLNSPAAHYTPEWHDCEITYFIVPLYTKIYLEAFEAKNFALNFLQNSYFPLANDTEFLLRFFLTSSRSYKDQIARNSTIQNGLKNEIIESQMPKFIWVAELSTKDLIKRKKANGLVILDATEADIYFNKPIIMAVYQDNMIKFDDSHKELEKIPLPLHEFSIFEHNLQEF
ncbi:MAG: hypothetical protein EZS26_002522 [Candidatus Ordinivivax streblomastigis]|uniref:Uncharacterized protein n=1 Tax=Candidatus Ordinivivax streblomastigis TaxID=2540710 RepID=A0A5M8NYU6_9BACT|nr:MAG: hypothetical protein EZS26_002522 [Candidatus Ordinivivax streblomastigis]